MKKVTLFLILLGFFSLKGFSEVNLPEESVKPSPYFFIPNSDASIDQFPLLETKAKVNISGVIAYVELTQVYKNEGKRAIEAIYVFPLSTKSAIHSMKMEIGERTIIAKIEERKLAQRHYIQAKKEGKLVSLLEQQRPNVFQMKVANIMPKDIVEVTVNYTELLIPEDGVYEFVFPTVVGPRYSGELTDPTEKDDWIESPYLHQGTEPSYNFDITVNIKTGLPISKIKVVSHKVDIDFKSENEAVIRLAKEEKKGGNKGGNKDFILRYVLKGKNIQTGLLLYPVEEEKFFLLMAQPPQKITLSDIPPREYLFIVDVSGSMYGFPLEVSKALIKRIINNLREKDYFNILFFSGGSKVLSDEPLPATFENKLKAISMLEAQRGGGGTRILSALRRALSLKKKEGLSRIIVIATDGYVAVEKEVFDLIRENLNKANFFAFGIGKGVDRYLIEGIARVGRGVPFIATDEKEAKLKAEKFLEYIKSPVLTDIKVEFEGFSAYDVEPSKVGDLFYEKPIVIFGKYKTAKGKIKITGKTPKGDFEKIIEVGSFKEDKENIALKYLWAREKLAQLSDYRKVGVDTKEEIIKLGLKYSLMTEFTSFIAIDTIKRETGEVVTVKQPLPLPEGVSDYAVEGKGIGGGFLGELYNMKAPPLAFEKEEIARSKWEAISKKELGQVYLKGGRFTQKLSMEKIENLLSPLKKTLGELFKKWELKEITIVLKIEGGRLINIEVKAYQGKGYEKEKLEPVLKKIKFPQDFTGKIEIELEYI